MLFANLEVNKTFRFRDQSEVYTKVGPDHFRKTSAGIHACCIPISSKNDGKFESVDEVRTQRK